MDKEFLTYYFKLQYLRVYRWLEDFGLWPKLTLLASPILFFALCALLRMKTEYSGYILFFIAFTGFLSLSEGNRVRHLDTLTHKNLRYSVRAIENVLLCVPFLVYFLYLENYILGLALILLGLIISFLELRPSKSRAIPTPFFLTPFENIVGFRKAFWLIPLSYFLAVKGIQVDNFNLAMSSLLIPFISLLIYYSELEPRPLVELYRKTAQDFLFQKIKFLSFAWLILSIVPIGVLCFYFPHKWFMVLGLSILVLLYAICFLLAKYAAYPKNMSIPFTVIIVSSVLFPPLLLLLISFFYRRSLRYLRPHML